MSRLFNCIGKHKNIQALGISNIHKHEKRLSLADDFLKMMSVNKTITKISDLETFNCSKAVINTIETRLKDNTLNSERMRSFFMGLHPRVGANSALLKFKTHKLRSINPISLIMAFVGFKLQKFKPLKKTTIITMNIQNSNNNNNSSSSAMDFSMDDIASKPNVLLPPKPLLLSSPMLNGNKVSQTSKSYYSLDEYESGYSEDDLEFEQTQADQKDQMENKIDKEHKGKMEKDQTKPEAHRVIPSGGMDWRVKKRKAPDSLKQDTDANAKDDSENGDYDSTVPPGKRPKR